MMCSYNKINGVWSCENPVTLGDLKNISGFKGYVMSDWGATHSTSIMEGLDVEMPSAGYMNEDTFSAGLKDGSITRAAIDDSAGRILYAMFAVGVMDEPLSAWDWKKQSTNSTTDASVASSRRLAAASTVLLKNTAQTLPLSPGTSSKFAVLGFGSDNAIVHGGGSGSVVPSYVARPVDAIQHVAGNKASVSYNDGTDMSAAVDAAAAADYAIVFVGTLSHEGGDRESLSLDDGCQTDSHSNQCKGNTQHQNELVRAVAAVNSKTIVVVSSPGAILMPWSTHANVSGVLMHFLAGQQVGNAIADVLFGSVNPSARLPITMPNEENEMRFSTEQWPGLPDPSKPLYAMYSEELLVGYRYYEAKRIQFDSGFPFGHGLSYTSFEYSNLKASSSAVSFNLKNTGRVAGAEVVQLYLNFPEAAGEPPLQLKGFQKVTLQAGGSVLVTLAVTKQDLSIWDAELHAFAMVKGKFGLKVGASSRDLRLSGMIQV